MSFNNASNNEKRLKLVKLKSEMASWMFATLSQVSKVEFIHLLKTMSSNYGLRVFKQRVDNAKSIYNQIGELCTPSQAPLIGKPFFYGINYVEDIAWNNGVKTTISKIHYDIDSFHTKKAIVTAKISSKAAFDSFQNVVQDALSMSLDDLEATNSDNAHMDDIVLESEVFKDIIDSQREYFTAQEKLREAEREKKAEPKTAASKSLPDIIEGENAAARSLLGLEPTVSTAQLIPPTLIPTGYDASDELTLEDLTDEIEDHHHPSGPSTTPRKRKPTVGLILPSSSYRATELAKHLKEAASAKMCEELQQKNGKEIKEAQKKADEAIARSMKPNGSNIFKK